MIQVERATPADFERVLPLLREFNNLRITPDRWRAIFHYSWPCEDDTRGFLLLDDERVVGFFGAILFEREIEGRLEKFANLTSWITLPEYRNHALLLFKAVASIEGRTLTCATPRKALLPLYLRFGFCELDSRLRILYPLPAFNSPLAWLRFRATSNPEKIRRLLNETDRAIFDHHRKHPCGQMLIHNRHEYCHIVFSRTKGRRFHFAQVHHISNLPVFLENLDRVRLRLALGAHAFFVMIDSRLLPEVTPKHSRLVDLGFSQVFKSAHLKPEQIDGLYTESILLNL
ncbi:MAG: hypothetical protein WCP06_11175 [Verrucomicrobiota bacterium]